MKLVIGTIPPEGANHAVQALHRAGIRGYTMSRVEGHAGDSEHIRRSRGTTARMVFAPRVRFEVAVPDALVDAAAAALREAEAAGGAADVLVLAVETPAPVRGDHRAADAMAPAA
jgi:nitrogen regulatory protein P-II 1